MAKKINMTGIVPDENGRLEKDPEILIKGKAKVNSLEQQREEEKANVEI